MNNLLKKIFIFLLLIVLIASFSASYKIRNLDSSVFVVALGIDKSETSKLKLTFEFIAPSPSTEGSSDAKPVFNSVECSSITNGINIMNAYLGRKANLSHCRLIVFSEGLAKDGISDEIYSLINEVQVRPSANLIISKCDTKNYIQNSTPALGILISKYFDIFSNNSQYVGYTCSASIGDFFNALLCDSCEPYAMLRRINYF